MVSLERIQNDLRELSQVGATPEGGVTRLAWSEAERAAHGLAARWMGQAGLRVRVDSVGNSFGTRDSRDTSLPALMVGSHLDSVSNGGNFDGTLGFASALETVRTLNERGIATRHPITLAVWAGEEAPRFTDAVLGSKLAMGQMERAELDRLADAEGTTLAEAMRRLGFDPDRMGEARWDPSCLAAYLELHIEQGTVLERLGCKIGVVTAIAAATRYRVTLSGSADHSGATPMGARRDALAAAAEIVLGVERIAGVEAGPATVGTVGILKVKPGAMTVIPGWVELGIDVRDSDPAAKGLASDKVEAMIQAVCRRRGIERPLGQVTARHLAPVDVGNEASAERQLEGQLPDPGAIGDDEAAPLAE